MKDPVIFGVSVAVVLFERVGVLQFLSSSRFTSPNVGLEKLTCPQSIAKGLMNSGSVASLGVGCVCVYQYRS